MAVPHVKPFSGSLPRKAPDERDPRALDLFPPWKGDALPAYGLVGIPYDGAVLGRKGCAQGPAAVREALRFNSSYNFEEDLDLAGLGTADFGDLDVPAADTPQAHERATAAMRHIFEHQGHPLMVGGDNSLTYASVRALAQSGAKRIGLLSLDAHLDVRVPNPDINSGCPNYLILENIPEVRPSNLVVVGLRRFANSKPYRDWATKKGMRLHPMKDIRRRGFQGILEQAIGQAVDGVDALYVSLDVDVVDQAWAPGVSSPSPDGLTPREVFDAVQLAGAQKVARGFEVVETAPNLDPTGNTARVAATALLQYLVGRVQSKLPPRPAERPPERTPAAAMGRAPPRPGWSGGPPPGRGGPLRRPPPSRPRY